MYYGTTIRIMTDFLSEITKKEDNGTASLSAKRERKLPTSNSTSSKIILAFFQTDKNSDNSSLAELNHKCYKRYSSDTRWKLGISERNAKHHKG